MKKKVVIGTRASRLAKIQTEIFVQTLLKKFPDIKTEIMPIITTGDKILDKNLYDIGGKALFVKELEEQLLNGSIDIAVHSLKDVPGVVPNGVKIVACLERSDPRDVFVSYKYKNIEDLPQDAIIGTSSVRRHVLLSKIAPHLKISSLRGNVTTRIQRVKDGEFDGAILAAAGLIRLGLMDAEYCSILPIEKFLPAAGQGIIALETRAEDEDTQELCRQINHKNTWDLAMYERSYLTYLDADCRTPLSAYACYKEDDLIEAQYMMANIDGSALFYHTERGMRQEASSLGIKAAKTLLKYLK